MKIHPDVLAAHAQFGGDLESMQKLYEWHDQRSLIDAARAFMELFIVESGDERSLSLEGVDQADFTDRFADLEAVLLGNEPCIECGGTGIVDSGGFHPWGESIDIPCGCKPFPEDAP